MTKRKKNPTIVNRLLGPKSRVRSMFSRMEAQVPFGNDRETLIKPSPNAKKMETKGRRTKRYR